MACKRWTIQHILYSSPNGLMLRLCATLICNVEVDARACVVVCVCVCACMFSSWSEGRWLSRDGMERQFEIVIDIQFDSSINTNTMHTSASNISSISSHRTREMERWQNTLFADFHWRCCCRRRRRNRSTCRLLFDIAVLYLSNGRLPHGSERMRMEGTGWVCVCVVSACAC